MSPAVVRRARNAPAAATVLARHLLRDTGHVAGLPRPWADRPAYRAALEALRAGELQQASELAAAAGPAGRRLARLVEGELALLESAAPDSRAVATATPDGPDRVLHLVTNALPETVAGYTVRTQGIAEAQRRAGHDAHVVTRLGFPVVKGHLAAAREVSVRGVPYHRLLPARLPLRADDALAADIERTGRLVERLRPTVLHAHSNHVNARVGLALRARFGIPLVYEVRGLLEETWLSRTGAASTGTDFYRLSRAAETAAMLAADAVVTISRSLRDELVARGVPAERIHVVPNGVDESWLAGPPPKASLHDRTLTVGLGGTLNAYEGVDVLVDAVALLRARGTDVRLLVVGDGPARVGLEKRAAERGVADATTFTGRLAPDAVREAYRRLDVFCLPRRDLPVTRLVPPLKPLEAMALGLPVVASDLPPLRELVGVDRGVLVPPGDAGALARALADLASPPWRRRELGATAQAWVASTRTWPTAATTYQHLYATTRGETR